MNTVRDAAAAFDTGLHVDDAQAAHALRCVTLRLRREVAWLWRERAAQGADGAPPGPHLPPLAAPALSSLDLARYADDKAAFFADDVTSRHLGMLIDRPFDTAQGGAGSAAGFSRAAQQLQLTPCERFVLALALLPVVDSAAAPVIATCLNEGQAREPTLALAQRLWPQPAQLLPLHDSTHRLYTHGLLVADGAPGWAMPLRVNALVACELLWPGAPLPAALQEAGPPRPATHHGRAAPVEALARAPKRASAPERRRIVPLLAASNDAMAAAAATLAAARGQTLLVPRHAGAPDQAAALMTVAWLRRAALYLPLAAAQAAAPPATAHEGHADAAPLPLPELPLSLYVGLPDRAALKAIGEPCLPLVDVPAPSTAEREAAWRQVLPRDADGSDLAAELARRFRGDLAAVRRLGAEFSTTPMDRNAWLAAARADIDLGALAQAVDPRFALSELMLPAAQTHQLDELVRAMHNLARVHQQWGTARAWNEGGLTALFAGPPGTGKTMAAEGVAQALRLPLYRIDLSQVVNKYIGETEKNLKRLFDAADASDVVLFFDEADALFGKRTEVKDAHDRYANLEISYLLERMERFKGLAILATNRRRDLDEAFMRRLRFVIEFPLPGVDERRRIWCGALPAGIDAGDVDVDFLAQRFALAGGHIRAIIFHACLQSADAGAPKTLTMQAVIRAVQREYDKLERTCSLDQFGPYVALMAPQPRQGAAR